MDMSKAIGLIETTSLACGIEAADSMMKKANVKLLLARPICPGKFLILIGGDVEDVNNSVAVGEEKIKEYCVDSAVIPNVKDEVLPAIEGVNNIEVTDNLTALGVVETFTVVAGILAGDAAVKAGGVKLIEIRPASGLGGKSLVTMIGDVSAVESGIRACNDKIGDEGLIVKSVVIPYVTKEVLSSIL